MSVTATKIEPLFISAQSDSRKNTGRIPWKKTADNPLQIGPVTVPVPERRELFHGDNHDKKYNYLVNSEYGVGEFASRSLQRDLRKTRSVPAVVDECTRSARDLLRETAARKRATSAGLHAPLGSCWGIPAVNTPVEHSYTSRPAGGWPDLWNTGTPQKFWDSLGQPRELKTSVNWANPTNWSPLVQDFRMSTTNNAYGAFSAGGNTLDDAPSFDRRSYRPKSQLLYAERGHSTQVVPSDTRPLPPSCRVPPVNTRLAH